MGKVLHMPMMGLRQYARYRKSQGLPGGTATSVHKALVAGRITRGVDGRIDSSVADAAWRANTLEREQSNSPQQERSSRTRLQTTAKKTEQSTEFRRGVGWLYSQVCEACRRIWPDFVRRYYSDMPRCDQVRLIALFCGGLERLTAVDEKQLPEITWNVLFGSEGAAVAAEYQALRQVWPAITRVDLVAGSDATSGADFLKGARSAAHAICGAGRRLFPTLIAREVFAPDDGEVFAIVHLGTLVSVLLEGWCAAYLDPESLRAIYWDGDVALQEQCRELREKWG
jgi:hypothetical protein